MKQILIAGAILALAGCSSGGTADGGSSGTTTKTLTIGGTFGSLSLMPLKPLYGIDALPMSVSEYRVRCVTLSGPLHAGEGVVDNSTKAFSLDITAGLNAPIGCFLLGDDAIVATLSFGEQDSMSGGQKHTTAYSPRPDSTSLTLGTINISGGFAVPVEAPTENGTAARPTFANMTGNWIVTGFYENEAELYIHPCDMDYEKGSDLNNACRANWSSKGMYVRQISASNGSTTRNGLSLWESQASVTACGGKEGVNLDTGWSAVGDWTTGGFTFATLDLSNIDSTMLGKARFKKSTYGGHTNCPKEADGTTELAGCSTATSCANFTYSSGATGSMQKAQCVMNALSSGGDMGYNWGDACGARPEINWHGSSTYKSDGTGCEDADCGIVNFDPAGASPANRFFHSELFINGSVGTANNWETFDCWGADVQQGVSITVTQKTSTTATFLVESTTAFAGGTDVQKQNCLDEDDWVASSIGKVRRMKLELKKN
jgi:hypothetical protein